MADEHLSSPARIEELRDKLQKDPTSKIFLQLAEELRRSNRFEEAVEVCLAGLAKHPGYTSARVTLGRAYMGAKRHAEARAEFERVIAAVPDNIVANRFLADLYYDDGKNEEALKRYRIVQMLGPGDEEVEARIGRLEGGKTTTPTGSMDRPGAPAAHTARPPAAAAPAPPASEGGGDDLVGFMDLKIDESVILNADMIAAALGQKPAGAAPPSPPPPVATAPRPAPPTLESDLGDVGADDFSEFSSPTVMLSAADLAKIPGLADVPSAAPPSPPVPPAPPPPPAEPSRPADLQSFAARSAQKFGIARPTAEARPPAPAAQTPPPAPAPPADEVGEMGMDDFSEFAAPTVMMNVADLVKMGALGDPGLGSTPAAAAPAPAPAPPAAVMEASAAAAFPEAEPEAPFEQASDESPFEERAGFAPARPVPVEPEPFDEAPSFSEHFAPADAPAAAAPVAEVFGTQMIPTEGMEALRARAAEIVEGTAGPFDGTGPAPGVSPGSSTDDALGVGPTPSPFEEEASPLAEIAAARPSPPDAEASPTLADLYFQQGHLEQALAIYERHLAVHPQDAAASSRVAEIRRRLAPQKPVASVAPAEAPKAPEAGQEPSDDRKKKIEKLSHWLAALKKH